MSCFKIISALRLFRAASRRSRTEEALAERFDALRQRRLPAAATAPLIAVNAPADAAYYAILGEIVSGLRARQAVRADQICTQALRPGASQSFRHFLGALLEYNFFTRRKWQRLYGLFCDRVGYRTTDLARPARALRQWRESWRIWRSLRNKDHLASISHGGILIGDLIIDTYLRLRPSPTIKLRDTYLLVVIRQALKDLDLALAYFRRDRPCIYLSIYTTYLSHGIPVRVALACGIKVVTFGNFQEFCTSVSLSHCSHTKDSTAYSEEFIRMPDRIEKKNQAARALEARFSGRIDAATAYMKRSAYAVATQEIPPVRDAIVIFLHDFYDSVHNYSWILFHDFWEWICFTIETLQAAGRDFWIKPHPNQVAQSSAEIDALQQKYPYVKFLAAEITNRQLAEAGMACAVTVFGSVAPEMAFLGIPSISCGDSPHASFDAFHLARTRQAYAAMLSNPPRPDCNADRLKEQACAYYYMHNLNLDANGALLRDRFVAIWAHMIKLEANHCFDKNELVSVLAALTDNAAFQDFSDTFLSDNPS